MNVTSVLSLVAATVFAVGVVGPAVAQTPSTPAPAPAPPAKSGEMKSGDVQMDKDKAAKKDKAAGKTKKKHAAKKMEKMEKTEGDSAAKTPEPKK